MIKISSIDLSSPAVQRAYKRLSSQQQADVKRALQDLLSDPPPSRLRFEKLHHPKGVYTIHATSNHSHKISFEVRDEVALIRVIGTHKQIDRAP